MIIFGTKAKYKTIGSGQFFCPHCQKTRNYEHKHAKNYFSLYFIPIIPLNDIGDFIECQSCRMTYKQEVLDFKPSKPQPDAARMLNAIKANLEKGRSIEYVISDLTAEGLDRDIAGNMVTMVIGDSRVVCPECDLTYAASVKSCPDCQAMLQRIATNE